MNESKILELLDQAIWQDQVTPALRDIAERVDHTLKAHSDQALFWEPVPLSLYGVDFPSEIKSSWVFVLRSGIGNAERHPNSRQRVMSFYRKADLQTYSDETWVSNVLSDDPTEPLENRWLSIPPNVWHRPVVPTGDYWTVVSFHTVKQDELIEETPKGNELDITDKRRYLELE